jgi:hypothetical protein
LVFSFSVFLKSINKQQVSMPPKKQVVQKSLLKTPTGITGMDEITGGLHLSVVRRDRAKHFFL